MPLEPLVAALREAIPGAANPAEAAAKVLHDHLPGPDVLTPEQRRAPAGSYAIHLLHVEADPAFTVIGLAWEPGAVTAVHDHVCWGAVGVLAGEETETRFGRTDDAGDVRLTTSGTTTYRAGEVCWFEPPHDIHRVSNRGTETAISLHVYGADLTDTAGSSTRTRYLD